MVVVVNGSGVGDEIMSGAESFWIVDMASRMSQVEEEREGE